MQDEMNERETAEAIEARAVEWLARIDAAGDDEGVQAELRHWLEADERRRGAYFRASAAWQMLDRAAALGAGTTHDPVETVRPSRRRFLWGGGALAGSLAMAAAGFTLWPIRADRHETAIGEIRTVSLDDGSVAEMNTATTLLVSMTRRGREVALKKGEAWFHVARDVERPFLVQAGPVRVRALGTAFAVRRVAGGSKVEVTEGVVEVWSTGNPANVRHVAAGSLAFVDEAAGAGEVVEAAGEIERLLAWRSGQLVFDGETLAEAIEELNRHNRLVLRVADPSLAGEKLVGRFRANDPETFARAAALMLDAQVSKAGGEITLSRN